MKLESILRFVLRYLGSVSLLALGAVVMPSSWMDATHQWLGMGELPEQPIVGYLARTASAFYALLGGLLWVVSFHPQRHRVVLYYLAGAIMVFGLILIGVDWTEGLPLWWRAWEGPWVMVIGGVVLWLTRRLPPAGEDRRH